MTRKLQTEFTVRGDAGKRRMPGNRRRPLLSRDSWENLCRDDDAEIDGQEETAVETGGRGTNGDRDRRRHSDKRAVGLETLSSICGCS